MPPIIAAPAMKWSQPVSSSVIRARSQISRSDSYDPGVSWASSRTSNVRKEGSNAGAKRSGIEPSRRSRPLLLNRHQTGADGAISEPIPGGATPSAWPLSVKAVNNDPYPVRLAVMDAAGQLPLLETGDLYLADHGQVIEVRRGD